MFAASVWFCLFLKFTEKKLNSGQHATTIEITTAVEVILNMK